MIPPQPSLQHKNEPFHHDVAPGMLFGACAQCLNSKRPYHHNAWLLCFDITPHVRCFMISKSVINSHPPLLLPRQQRIPNRKHLPRHRPRKPIHLSRILLNLPRIQHNIQSTRLLRQLKQPLPLILRQQRLLRRRARRILRLALLLPRGDLLLLACEGALIVLVVVELGVVGLDAVEEEVAGLFKEGVDTEVEGVEVRC